MKVAIFEPNFLVRKPLAFSSTVLLQNQIPLLSRLGCEILVVTEAWKDDASANVKDGCKILTLRGKLNPLRSLSLLTDMLTRIPPQVFSLDLVSEAATMLRRTGVDIIYGCGSLFFGVFIALLGRLAGIPTVHYVFHILSRKWWKAAMMEGYDMPLSYILSNFVKNVLQTLPRRDFLMKWGLRNTTKLIASSAFVRDTLCQFGLDKNDVPIVYPSVKLPTTTSQGTKDADVPIITYFGNLWWGRGALDVVKAFHHVLKQHKKAKLMLATTTVHTLTQHYFNETVNKYNLRSNIISKGIVKDVHRELLDPSTVVALPYREGPSMKLIETMATAKPVITTNIGWTPEIIVDNFNGFLIDVGDIQGLADNIGKVLKNPELAERIGKNARETVKAKCNIEDNTRSVLAILKKTRSQ